MNSNETEERHGDRQSNRGRVELNQVYRFGTITIAMTAITLLALLGASDTAIITIGGLGSLNCGIAMRNTYRH